MSRGRWQMSWDMVCVHCRFLSLFRKERLVVVVAGGVDNEFADELAGVAVQGSDVEVVGQRR
jgi:hypothetical protein